MPELTERAARAYSTLNGYYGSDVRETAGRVAVFLLRDDLPANVRYDAENLLEGAVTLSGMLDGRSINNIVRSASVLCAQALAYQALDHGVGARGFQTGDIFDRH